MHPLLENLNIVKSKLLKLESSGICLDIFTLPNDMQIYSSSNFSKVLCVTISEKENKHVSESAPSRPPSRIAHWNLNSKQGQIYMDSFLVFSSQGEKVSCIWIHLYRCVMNETQFKGIIQTLYNRCTEDTTLYIVCVDGELAAQYAMSHIIYIDRDDNMQMQYHKQPIKTVSLAAIRTICSENGFMEKNSINGEDMLKLSNINCLPYDLWTSQTFFLLQFKSKFHFKRYC
jgi:hypothetical protein